uniref:SJCHGC00897 protein n=1 Tax=Schistosoma japonicum TaxID=6182 RepID=Q5DED9_SCHJA|nr:SJCHGC00897 protein [Schistosoma japonicum]
MTLSRFPCLIWEQIVGILPPVHHYEIRCIIGEDLIDQTLELKSEIISTLELANNNEELAISHFTKCSVDLECFASIYLEAAQRSKQNGSNQVVSNFKEKSEVEHHIPDNKKCYTYRNLQFENLLTEYSDFLLRTLNTSHSEYKNANRPSELMDPTLSQSKVLDCNLMIQKKQTHDSIFSLEFFSNKDSISELHCNRTPLCSSVSSSRSSADTSSSSSSNRIMKKSVINNSLSLHQNLSHCCTEKQKLTSAMSKTVLNDHSLSQKSVLTHKPLDSKVSKERNNNQSDEAKKSKNGISQNFDDHVHLPVIFNSLTPNYSKQSKQSFPMSKTQFTNENPFETNPNKSVVDQRTKGNLCISNRYNLAQRFRQMILKARQESGDY